MAQLQNIVVITGRSGAGKTTAARSLEDLGYYVVDNLPMQLLDELLVIEKEKNIGVVVDVRETESLGFLPKKWDELSEKKYRKQLIYLNACDKVLLERYHETRRLHPLDHGCGTKSALKAEEIALTPIRKLSACEIITDKLSSHELRNEIKKQVTTSEDKSTELILLSFGYKHGVPPELDFCFDVRFLPNPYYDLNLREKSGLDKEVSDFVLSHSLASDFLVRVEEVIAYLFPLYRDSGWSRLNVAIGCTGGQHRSPSMALALASKLKHKIARLRVEHRDLAIHH